MGLLVGMPAGMVRRSVMGTVGTSLWRREIMYSPSEEGKMEGEGTESKGNLEGCLSRGFPDDKVPDPDIFHRFMRDDVQSFTSYHQVKVGASSTFL